MPALNQHRSSPALVHIDPRVSQDDLLRLRSMGESPEAALTACQLNQRLSSLEVPHIASTRLPCLVELGLVEITGLEGSQRTFRITAEGRRLIQDLLRLQYVADAAEAGINALELNQKVGGLGVPFDASSGLRRLEELGMVFVSGVGPMIEDSTGTGPRYRVTERGSQLARETAVVLFRPPDPAS